MASIVSRQGARGTTYTVRYRDSAGKSCQESFKTRPAAKVRKAELDNAAAHSEHIAASSAKLARFAPLLEKHVESYSGRTRDTYMTVYRLIVKHYGEEATLWTVANDRNRLDLLVNTVMLGRSVNYRRNARRLITETVGEAIAAGSISGHRLANLKLVKPEVTEDEINDGEGAVRVLDDLTVDNAIAQLGIIAVLQRRLGLRLGEARGVRKDDFSDDLSTLRLRWQASTDGRKRVALKHRDPGKGRDIPVPEDVRKLIADLPDGPLCPGQTVSTYITDGAALGRYRRIGVRSHDLRHTFATRSLEAGGLTILPTLSRILGHSDVSVTLKFYIHETAEGAASALSWMS